MRRSVKGQREVGNGGRDGRNGPGSDRIGDTGAPVPHSRPDLLMQINLDLHQ